MKSGRLRIDRRLLTFALSAIALMIALWMIPTEHMVSFPGSATETAGMVLVNETPESPRGGRIMLTTVVSREANALLYLVGGFYPRADLTPTAAYLRPGEDLDDYMERTRQMMRESQDLAKYVAFDRLGYEVAFEGEGVLVVSIRSDSLALETLQPGDVIIEADGRPTSITDDLLDVVGSRSPGDSMDLTFLRGNDGERREHTAPVTLIESPDSPGSAIIGIGVTTEEPRFSFPREVSIDAGDIGGPSAGLAFTLALIDELDGEESLVGDLDVACTGTMNVRGEVGPVGGVRLKAYAAERAGADVFMVPADNYDDALEASVDLEVVAVETIDDALEYLRDRSFLESPVAGR